MVNSKSLNRLTRRSAEITERRYGGVVNPYNLGRSLVGVRGLYLRFSEDIRQAVLVQIGRASCRERV